MTNIEMKNEMPAITLEYLQKEQEMWRQSLPADYQSFLLKTNGGVPVKRSFRFKEQEHMVVQFLSVFAEPENNEFGSLDIDVILSQIEDRLTDNEDLIGVEVLPIAELFAGDYICIDFKENPNEPCICIWDHEESMELEPVTYRLADSFSDFLKMLF